MSQKTKVCYVLSYRFPNYVRSETLLHSLELLDNLEVYRATNSKKGIIRYFQTLGKLIAIRLKHRPDFYILGFRGYEIYWPVRLLTLGKPLIYDEFVEPVNWFTVEHKKFSANSLAGKLLKTYVRSTIKASQRVMYDTDANARLSAETAGVSIDKYLVVPVGTDESVFKPLDLPKKSNRYEVLFYGSMLPLHGIEYIVKSLDFLGENVVLHLVGDINNLPSELLTRIRQEINRKRIIHTSWIPYPELPKTINQADICLGGPFGGTSQAMRVITGKTFQSLAMGKLTLVGKTNVESSLQDGQNCLAAEQKSAEAIAEKITWAISNPQKAAQIAQAGRQIYLENFSNAKIAEKLAPLFNR